MINDNGEIIHDSIRISCNLEEALLYMLGISIGPLPEGVDLSLDDILLNECERAETVYSNAKGEKCSVEEIAAAFENLKKADLLCSQARQYERDIKVELTKKDPVLIVDPYATKNPKYPYITFTSLEQWILKEYGISVLDFANSQTLAKQLEEQFQQDHQSPVNIESNITSKQKNGPRLRMREQEYVILDEIRKLEYDPKNLPKRLPGKRGVKAEVRKLLLKNELFTGKTVFDDAWERLRDDSEIVDQK
jgi:hypothetical protein